MKTSLAQYQRIRMFESSGKPILKAYKDSGGHWTIGYGHTQDVKEGDIITPDKAEHYLMDDVELVELYLSHFVKVPLRQNQYDALVDFIFNMGIGKFAKSTLLLKLNNYDYEGAANEFERWDIKNAKENPGLITRHRMQKELFTKR